MSTKTNVLYRTLAKGTVPLFASYVMNTLPSGVKVLPVNPTIEDLSWLIGTWRSEEPGTVTYPTMANSVKYGEEITFKSTGQPMLVYSSFTWNHQKKTPMHQEFGFLKINPESKVLSLHITSNTDYCVVEEGGCDGKEIKLATTNWARKTSAPEPKLVKYTREFKPIDGGEKLKQLMYMETKNTPLTLHLEATYKKVN